MAGPFHLLFVSLGCDKNLSDSEFMLGMLQESGFVITNEEEQADIIVVNTCCFINDAKEESVNTILEMAEYKKTGRCQALLVPGTALPAGNPPGDPGSGRGLRNKFL